MIWWYILKVYPSLVYYLGWLGGLEAVRYGLYGLCAVGVFVVISLKRRFRKNNLQALFGLASLLFLAVWMYHYWFGEETIVRTEVMLNARALFLALTLGWLLSDSKKARIAFILLLIYIGGMQTGNLLSSLTTAGADSDSSEVDITAQRIHGVYMGSWHVGYSAIVTLGAALCALGIVQKRSTKLMLTAVACVAIANLFLSINRANLPATLLIAAFWLCDMIRLSIRTESGKANLRRMAGAAAGALAILVTAAIRYPEKVRFYAELWIMRLSEVSDQSVRWETIVAGKNMFAAHPFVGVGWDAAAARATEFGGLDDFSVHNIFVQCAAEGGLLGCGFVAVVFLIIPWILYKRTPKETNRLTFAGTWLAILFFNTVASNLHLESHWDFLFFWLVVVCWRDMDRGQSVNARTAGLYFPLAYKAKSNSVASREEMAAH